MATIWVRGKKKKIYLRFRWQGREFCEPTIYECEKEGIKDCKCRKCRSAAALGVEVERRIFENTFDLQEYFPNSKALINLKITDIKSDALFSEYAEQWLDFKETTISYSSYKKYKSQLNRIRGCLPFKLSDIKPYHIRMIIKAMSENNNKPKTIKDCIDMLKNIFKQAVEDDIIKNNPCTNISLPKVVRDDPNPFSKNEVFSILNEINLQRPDLTCFYAIGFFAGLRTGEILALEWGDVDFQKMQISVNKTLTEGRLKKGTKTGKSIKVDIIPLLLPYIQKQKEYSFLMGGALFISRTGERIRSYDTIARTLKSVLYKLGIEYREPYQMRHTFAVMMLGAGEDPNWVKNQLGHSNLTMLFTIYGNWYKADNTGGQKFEKSLQCDQIAIKCVK